MKSDTPRTDESTWIETNEANSLVLASLARTLERELNVAQTKIAELEQTIKNHEEVHSDHNRLVREMDVAMHGEDGAAKQASLCDLIVPAQRMRARIVEEGHKGNCCLCDPGTVYDFLQENEINRLRLVLINQISRTRQLQERLEMVEEATNSCLKGELSALACMYVIRAIVIPVKITDKDREIAKNLVDKTE